VSEADTIGKKVVDSIAGVPAFIARLAALRYMFPEFPEYMIWEIDSQSQGGKPGEGALIAGHVWCLEQNSCGHTAGKTAKLAAECLYLQVLRRLVEAIQPRIITSSLKPVSFKSIGAAKSAYRNYQQSSRLRPLVTRLPLKLCMTCRRWRKRVRKSLKI
jgi:hypothetical protein